MGRAVAFREGMRDGVPIGLGYFAVAFSLGIAARSAGMTAAQGFVASLLTNASAGEFAAFTLMATGGGYLELAVITLITNARYVLMSCSMSQKLGEDVPLWQRLILGFDLTDEIFGIAMARPGKADPFYSFGAMVPALPGWSTGTALGIIVGNVVPGRVVSALSVALFGMFLAIVIPPARDNRVLLGVVATSFALSLAMSVAPVLSDISAGTRIIILTVLIAGVAAWLFPVSEEEEADHAA